MGASFGTTGTCGFDNLEKMGEMCNKYGLFLSVDGAYAGLYMMLPEKRHLFKYIENADLYLINFAKSGLIGLNGAFLFVKDKK